MKPGENFTPNLPPSPKAPPPITEAYLHRNIHPDQTPEHSSRSDEGLMLYPKAHGPGDDLAPPTKEEDLWEFQ